MITRDSRYKINGEYVIDIDDIDKIKNIRWRPDGKGYAHNNSDRQNTIYLHRLIMNCPNDKYIDHIDKNIYNNKKQNLRIVDHIQNDMNKCIKSDNTSGVTGVSWHKQKEMWRARINLNKKQICLILHSDFDICVKKRLVAEALYFKEYSPQYNPSTKTIQLKYKSHNDNLETFIEVDMNGNIINFKKLNK